ncbi:hypothetical protein HKX48_004597, partial [Thoreauomyces humboldtii]
MTLADPTAHDIPVTAEVVSPNPFSPTNIVVFLIGLLISRFILARYFTDPDPSSLTSSSSSTTSTSKGEQQQTPIVKNTTTSTTASSGFRPPVSVDADETPFVPLPDGIREFTASELAAFDGSDEAKPVYVAINGK